MMISFLLLTLGVSQEQEYVFKAKGEFAKELKALMEKHAQEGKVEVEVVDAASLKKDRTGMLDKLLASKETKEDIAFGKEVYEKTCVTCHGAKAEKSTYPNARILKTLSKEEFVDQLRLYRDDLEHGHSTRLIMSNQASGLLEEEIISLAAYIHTLK